MKRSILTLVALATLITLVLAACCPKPVTTTEKVVET